MRKILVLLLLIASFGLLLSLPRQHPRFDGLQPINFEASMGGPDYWEYKLMMTSKENQDILKRYEKMYYSGFSENSQAAGRIPKIIHHIWLGPKMPPPFFDEYRASWLKFHPDWEFRLWTDKEAAELDMDLRDQFDTSENWGEKADILRAEILDRMGGLYVDVDFECLKSFGELAAHFDFFAGLEPPHEGIHPKTFPRVTVSDALIGACPGHPIIKKWKMNIQQKWLPLQEALPEGKRRVLERTFYTFGDAVYAEITNPLFKSIVFPTTYFYPYTFSQLSQGRKRKGNIVKNSCKELLYLCRLKERPRFSTILPETMAIHYWGGSWQKSCDEHFLELHERVAHIENVLVREVQQLKQELEAIRRRSSPLVKDTRDTTKEQVN